MPITLPNLDDVTWKQLNEEARSLIPAYAPGWTNFNPSDPGITLLELFAYFSELLMYRANRITDQQRLIFLELLNGPSWYPRATLEAEMRATLLTLAQPSRAVTPSDYEALAIAASQPRSPEHGASETGRIARARCLPERNLQRIGAATYRSPAPGHVSVVVVAQDGSAPSSAVMQAVRQALDEARLITVKVHVVPPVFVSFGVRLTLVKQPWVSASQVRSAASKSLRQFFDPICGGLDKIGWPFGRNVYISELYRLMAQVPGVDYVCRSTDPVSGEDLEELVVEPADSARRRFNDNDDLESIEVHDEELVFLNLAPENAIASSLIVQERAGRS